MTKGKGLRGHPPSVFARRRRRRSNLRDCHAPTSWGSQWHDEVILPTRCYI